MPAPPVSGENFFRLGVKENRWRVAADAWLSGEGIFHYSLRIHG